VKADFSEIKAIRQDHQDLAPVIASNPIFPLRLLCLFAAKKSDSHKKAQKAQTTSSAGALSGHSSGEKIF
jgi:hypothetical protein